MMDISLILVTVVLVLIIYLLFRDPEDVFTAQGIPGPRNLPVIGTSLRFFTLGILGSDEYFRKTYGKVIRQTFFGKKALMVFDAELLKDVMIKESSSFTDHMTAFKLPRPFDRGMTTLQGDDWRRVRHAVSPTFTTGKLKKMTSLVFHSVELLTDKFLSLAETGSDIDMKEYFKRYTMAVIAETMFGMQIDVIGDGSHEFVNHANKIMNFSGKTIFMMQMAKIPIIGRLFKNVSFFEQESADYLVKVIEHAIAERKGHEEEFHDFLSLMLKAEIEEGELEKPNEKTRGLTNDEIISQSVLFMLAGFETTSIALTYTAFLLALHPEEQERCRDEVLSEFDDGSPEAIYESLSRMPYLDQCLKESVRLYPPAPRTDRVSNKDVMVGDIRVPKDAAVIIPIHSVLRDPDLWEEPERFNPDRFSSDSAESGKVPFQFLVFGNGPRNCIGKRFALLEAKLLLANILRKMRFVTCETTPKEPLQFTMIGISKPKDKMILRMEKIG